MGHPAPPRPLAVVRHDTIDKIDAIDNDTTPHQRAYRGGRALRRGALARDTVAAPWAEGRIKEPLGRVGLHG